MKQGSMTVSGYRDKFLQLSRYAPEEVAQDEKKQELFLEGLHGGLQYQLVTHTFSSFQHMIDKVLVLQRKRRELDERKRKFIMGQDNHAATLALACPCHKGHSSSILGCSRGSIRISFSAPTRVTISISVPTRWFSTQHP